MVTYLPCISFHPRELLQLESVILLPPHGIQFETHRGLFCMSLATTRRFIPLSTLRDVVINEGLRRWDVRYYLAAIRQNVHGELGLEVAFETLLPHFPVLLDVYRGVQEVLFHPYENKITKQRKDTENLKAA